jgi:hypothetical protein
MILNTAHVWNVLPSSALDGSTPFEAFYGRKTDVGYLHPFGCLAYSHIPDDTCWKYEFVSHGCFLLGHVHNTSYILWDLSSKHTICSRHIHFDKHIFYGNPTSFPLHRLLGDGAPAVPTVHSSVGDTPSGVSAAIPAVPVVPAVSVGEQDGNTNPPDADTHAPNAPNAPAPPTGYNTPAPPTSHNAPAPPPGHNTPAPPLPDPSVAPAPPLPDSSAPQ